ncbi:MAG: hypothetical protein AB1578_07985 [Thermodesulfobacteriota bacterium]
MGSFSVRFAAILSAAALCVFAQAGHSAQAGQLGEDAAPDPRERVRELREERRAQQPWITAPEIDRETVRELLGDPDVAIVDVTCLETRAKIPAQIPGAVWRDCTQVEQWAPLYRRDQTIVVYCA